MRPRILSKDELSVIYYNPGFTKSKWSRRRALLPLKTDLDFEVTFLFTLERI